MGRLASGENLKTLGVSWPKNRKPSTVEGENLGDSEPLSKD